jgi:hypothetical protein
MKIGREPATRLCDAHKPVVTVAKPGFAFSENALIRVDDGTRFHHRRLGHGTDGP